MDKTETISFYEFFQKFPNEESARIYFEDKRWAGNRYCPHCGSLFTVECKDHRPMPYRCKDCRKHFSVRTGTVLAESRLPLHQWLMAIYMLTTARKGISSVQMAKQLGVTQKTAWFLAQRIRECWLDNNTNNDSNPTVEVDETYIGGKEKNRHASKKKRLGSGSVGKAPLNRNKKVHASHVDNVRHETLHNLINQNVEHGATVITDYFRSYNNLENYNHKKVNHTVGEYVKNQAHTNGIESFWAILKRGYYGIYHFMSPKHLQRYVNEFSYRYNLKECDTVDIIENTIVSSIGKRLKYKELIANA